MLRITMVSDGRQRVMTMGGGSERLRRKTLPL